MNSIADDVAHYVAGHGTIGAFGGDVSWCVSCGAEAASPADVITVYDTGGGGPDTDELDLESPTFQVRVRAVAFRDGYDKQREIRDALIFDSPISMATSTVIGIEMTSDIMSIGRDDSGRFIIVANYRAIRKEKE